MSFPRYPKYKDSGVEWLGEVPEGWGVKRFQRCVFVAEGQVNPEDATYSSMALIAPNHVEAGTGRLLALESASAQGAESGKYLCKAGDVVFSKIRPALRKVCLAPEDCLCSADMYPLRSHSGLLNPFLMWVMLSEHFSSIVTLDSQRVAMPKVNRESLKEVMLVLPGVEEQQQVASFLNRETASIDALIAEQERLIELLREKRQAVISHAVTKGLDPTVPMKDSGVEWLGEVPAHWAVLPIKALAHVGNGSTPSREQPLYWASGSFPWLNSSVVNDDPVLSADQFVTSLALQECHLPIVRPPAVLIGLTGQGKTRGMAAMLHFESAISQHLAFLRPRDTALDAHFLCRVLQMAYPYLRRDSDAAGSTKGAITCEDLKCLKLAMPPLSEQRQIVQQVALDTEEFDVLLTEAQRAIDLLQERRTALISAAVTGQIDVRAHAPATPAPQD